VTWAFVRVAHNHQPNASWGLVIFVGAQLGVAAIYATRLMANLSARRFVITT
jgi:hypothetical protein